MEPSPFFQPQKPTSWFYQIHRNLPHLIPSLGPWWGGVKLPEILGAKGPVRIPRQCSMSCVVPPKVNRKTQITTKVPWLWFEAIETSIEKFSGRKKESGFWSGEHHSLLWNWKKRLKIENPVANCGHYKALPRTEGPSQECSKEDMSK